MNITEERTQEQFNGKRITCIRKRSQEFDMSNTERDRLEEILKVFAEKLAIIPNVTRCLVIVQEKNENILMAGLTNKEFLDELALNLLLTLNNESFRKVVSSALFEKIQNLDVDDED